MFEGITFYQACWYFLLYGMLGWILEVVYHTITCGEIVNRGFLNGPTCPIYGVGMVVFLGALSFIGQGEPPEKLNSVLIFFVGMTLCTLVELIGGFLLDKIYHARWWDYSQMPFNLNGYICAAFSIMWGIATVLAVKLIHPLVAYYSVAALPERFGRWILFVLFVIFDTDLVVTVIVNNKVMKEIAYIDDLSKALRRPSDAMSKAIGENTQKLEAELESTRVQMALGKAELMEDLEEKREEFQKAREEALTEFRKRYSRHRLIKAFPTMTSKDFPEGLEVLKKYLKDLNEER